LLLAPWEEYFLDEIRDLPIERSSAPHLDQDMKVKVLSLPREFLFYLFFYLEYFYKSRCLGAAKFEGIIKY